MERMHPTRTRSLALLVFVLLLGLACASKDCIWEDEIVKHDKIKAWEVQAQPHRHKIRDRDKAIKKMEQLLEQLSEDPDSGVQFVRGSRWMSIFQEHAFMVNTRHGHPLHPDEREKHECPFPWKGFGYLRLRQYKVLVPAGAYVPTAMPGMADLTFKMKNLDPDTGPGNLQLPEKVEGAKLTAKLENDVHCDHQRVSMSPLYKPVSQALNISLLANVKQYYPNLAQLALLSEDEQLPFMHQVYRAKIMWVVLFNGVIGEANLVIKYNTTLQDAVAGARPKNGEVSLRIRREVAEATGTTGEEGRRALYSALDTVGRAMQVFRDAGWDGKTPSVQPERRKKDNGRKQGCWFTKQVSMHDASAGCCSSSSSSSSSDENGAGAAAILPRPLKSMAVAAGVDNVGARAAVVRQQHRLGLSLWMLQPFGHWIKGVLQQLLPTVGHHPLQLLQEQQEQGADAVCCACDEDFDYDEPVWRQSAEQGIHNQQVRQAAAPHAPQAGQQATQGTDTSSEHEGEAYMVW